MPFHSISRIVVAAPDPESIGVAEGDEVKAGEELAVVEAMKMENSLRAEEDVVIAKVHAQEGDSLEVDQPILEFAK